MDLSEIVADYMRRRNMSQYELIKRSQLSKPSVQAIVRGKSYNVTLGTILSLAVAFDVHPLTIFEKLFPWGPINEESSTDQPTA